MLKSVLRFYLPLIVLILFANLPEAMTLLHVMLGDRLADSLSGIHDFMHENTQGFLIILWVGIYFEYVSGPRTVNLTRKALDDLSERLQRPSRTASAKEQLTICLQIIYATQDVKNLVEAVFTEKPVLSDVDVGLRLSDCPEDTSQFLYSSSISFKCSTKNICIALTSEASHQAILSTLPGITLSRALPFGLTATNLEANKAVIVAEASDGDRVEKINLVKMTKREADKLLSHVSLPPDSIYLFKLEVDNMASYRMKLVFPDIILRKDCGYVFWNADSPLFLRSISIDASTFNRDRRGNFNMHCNIMSYKSFDATYRKSGYLTVSIESWLTYGQGVVFSWR